MTDRNTDMRHILSQIRTLTGARVVESSDEDDGEYHEFPHTIVALRDARSVTIHAFEEDGCIQVYATDGQKQIAVGSYEPEREYFRRIDVDKEYRRHGLATAMYDYISNLGYTIKPSPYQQPDGVAFWNSGRNPRSLNTR